MDCTIIDSRTEKHSYAFGTENVKTKMTLVNMGERRVGLIYDVKYSGVYGGHVCGGPDEVTSNVDKDIWRDGKDYVHLKITRFSKTATHVSMHVKVTVCLKGKHLGTHTIFDHSLAGDLAALTGWRPVLTAVEAAVEEVELAPVP